MTGARLTLFLFLAAALAQPRPVFAQLAPPGALEPGKAAGLDSAAKPTRARTPSGRAAGATAESPEGHPLLLTGATGLLQVSGKGATLHIDKLRLQGEGISDPSQRCIVDIVGETPIEARSVGRPEGVERYEAVVPACPFSFDLLPGAVLTPAQTRACVFKAADCQANPGGLWGPEGEGLVKDASAIAHQRARAESAMVAFLQALQAHYKGKPEAEDLTSEQSDFAAKRDDVCRDYAKEAAHGFCASRLTEARALALKARLEALVHRSAKRP
jgi:hypothetical protein